MDLILSNIKDGQLPSDPSQAKKVKVRVARFTIVNDELYERGFSLAYLKCLNPKEGVYVLREIHEGICGNHLGPQSLVGKAIRARTPTRETPFKLVFGTEAVIPVEMGLSNLRRAHYDKISNNDELRLSLDCLSEVRDEASQRMARYHQKMPMYHNQRVKLKRFNPDDMVLRKVSQATKDPTQGKLGPTWEGSYKVIHYSRRESYYLNDLDGNPLPHPWNVEYLKKYYQ